MWNNPYRFRLFPPLGMFRENNRHANFHRISNATDQYCNILPNPLDTDYFVAQNGSPSDAG